jgi:Kef-type K+ transport system membrane component KefB
MLLLGLVTALQGGESVNIAGLLLIFAQALAFIVLIVVVGTRLMRRASSILDAPVSVMSPISLSLALCLGLAVSAAYLGLAAIIGAFLAGMIAAESRQQPLLEKNLKPIEAFLVPFFFVVTGAKVELASLASWAALGTLVVVTLLATAGKIVGCGLGALSLGKRSALIVGVGMVPRGEVGIIVASLGLQARLFSSEIYALIIAMSLLTSIIAPPALKALMKEPPAGTAAGA